MRTLATILTVAASAITSTYTTTSFSQPQHRVLVGRFAFQRIMIVGKCTTETSALYFFSFSSLPSASGRRMCAKSGSQRGQHS